MDPAQDTVAFLAQSENRVSVLEALATAPRTRRRLLDELSISRVTLGRILRELEERRWIVRSGRRYEITPLGELVIDEFLDLLETMDVEVRLRNVMAWFPTDLVTFDVRELRDAEIVVPSPGDLTVHVRRAAECYRTAERARVLTYQVGLPVLEAIREATVENDLQFEAILTPALLDGMTSDPEMEPLALDVLDAPTVGLYTHEDDIPSCLFVTDATVGIALSDDEGMFRALLLSENQAVFEWAVATYDAYRETATPISPGALAR